MIFFVSSRDLYARAVSSPAVPPPPPPHPVTPCVVVGSGGAWIQPSADLPVPSSVRACGPPRPFASVASAWIVCRLDPPLVAWNAWSRGVSVTVSVA